MVDGRNLENFHKGMKTSGSPDSKTVKDVSFLPCTRVCIWRRKSLLPSNENFFLMNTQLRTFANSQGTRQQPMAMGKRDQV